MATSSVALCPVCNEEMDGMRRSPCILPCSHCMCNSCFAQSISDNDKTCPVCCKSFKPSSVLNFERNATDFDECPYTRRTATQGNRLAQFIGENKHTSNGLLTNCQQTAIRISSSIRANTDLRNTILEEDKEMAKNIDKMKEIEKKNSKILRYLQRKNVHLRLSLQEGVINTRDLQVMQSRLEEARSFQEAAPILDETEALHNDVQTWKDNLDVSMTNDEYTRENIEENVQGMNEQLSLIHEIITTAENLCKNTDLKEEEGEDDYGGYIEPILSLQRKNSAPTPLTVDDLRTMTPLTRCHLTEGRVFVLHNYKGRQRQGLLSLSENNEMLLSHFGDGTLPPNAHVLQYNDVMSRENVSSQLTFLELGDINSNIGTLYIRLSSNNKRTYQFSRLCTGEMGPSYAKTKLLQIGNKGHDKLERVRFGDYENNDGTGGRPLFPELCADDEDLFTPCLAGVVEGVCKGENQIGGQFIIRTKDNPTRNCSQSFGRVERGLEVLDKIIKKYHNIGDVFIKECGLVLWPKGSHGSPRPGGFRKQVGSVHRTQGNTNRAIYNDYQL